MIINTAPDNLVTFGGVTSVSEFRIKNSAKAFGILSSGLYANKIRAIIRELGCNAYDSHVAAGCKDRAFDVHLPTTLHPFFAIRDYGVGLDHDEVSNIYTTYFESTKTHSNDFIGALGLGSKSPFSYTDNFTVTAIKNGRKGVYSAFINNDGVPAVALMGEEATNEDNGVEVRFAVNDSSDYRKFISEAENVFRYFAVAPNFTGYKPSIHPVNYEDMELIPNVRLRKEGNYQNVNYAIMGNIAYPIDVPNQKNNLGALERIANAGLDICFDIGEVEFQASREGLSYTEKTIAAIRAKYQAVNDALAANVAKEASQITNEWERADFLVTRSKFQLWSVAVDAYLVNNPSKLIVQSHGRNYRATLAIEPATAEKNFNITIKSFRVERDIARENRPKYDTKYEFESSPQVYFVINTANAKIWEQSKYHFKTVCKNYCTVFVLYATDPNKPVLYKEFLESLHSPMPKQILEVSALLKKEREQVETGPGRKINLMSVKMNHNEGKSPWEPHLRTLAELDPKETYYYLELKGYQTFSKFGNQINISSLVNLIRTSNIPKLANVKLFGVRQSDIETVKSLPNWVPVEDYIEQIIGSITEKNFYSVVINKLDKRNVRMYTYPTLLKKLNADSPFRVFGEKVTDMNSTAIYDLCKAMPQFAKVIDIGKIEEKAKSDFQKIYDRYPMLKLQSHSYYDYPEVLAEYINLVDQHKGVN